MSALTFDPSSLSGRHTVRSLLGATLLALGLGAAAVPQAWAQHRHPGPPMRGGPGWGYRPGYIRVLPAMATLVTIGAISYWYANGVYYRSLPAGGYEAVPPPEGDVPLPASPERLYIYPRNGQSAERQASDEYECHKWAARQSGFDPMAVADGTAPAGAADATRRNAYQRAQTACLEGRGYTVR